MPEKPEPATERGPSASRSAVRFVLVEPQHGGNVGAAARALKNLGFERMCVVAPGCDPRGDDARRMAKDAVDLLDRIEIRDDLDAALRAATSVVGTSRRRGKQRRPHWRLDRLAPELGRMAGAGEIAAVFGREAHGLSDAELDRCTHLVHFPASEDYPSFNLAQSVLLVAYEMALALELHGPSAEETEPAAEHHEREAMYEHLRIALETIGFLHPDSAAPMMRRIRRMLGRAELTSSDVRVLRGIARQTLWVSRQAGLDVPQEPDDAP